MATLGSMPQKQTALIDECTFEYVCSGNGRPVIVLLNGSGGPIEGWYKVYSALERLGTVFAYNRLGVGRSSKPCEPQTAEVAVSALRALLNHIGLAPPYLLVGHSLGGLFANAYARMHPDEVCGVALIDATAPGDVCELKAHRGLIQRGLEAVLNTVLGKNEFSEVTHAQASADFVNTASPFPDLPLVVVTGGKASKLMPARVREIRAVNQKALSTLSPRGRQVIAKRSGHFPQFSEPELVIAAISSLAKEVVASAETR